MESFHFTTERPLTKFVPITVRVKAPCPAVLLVGERVVVVGTGFSIVNIRAGVDFPPPGAELNTVTLLVPAALISEIRMAAVSCVADT